MDSERRKAATRLLLRERDEKGAIDYDRWSRDLDVPKATLRTWVHRASETRAETETRNETDPTNDPKPLRRVTESAKVPAGLTAQQYAAMAFILAGDTFTAAALKVGVHRVTVSTWATLPAWRVAWEVEQQRLKEEVRNLLDASSPRAAMALDEIQQDAEAPAGPRVAAAVAILDRTGFGKTESLELSGPDGSPVQVQLEALTDHQIEVLALVPEWMCQAIEAHGEAVIEVMKRAAIEGGFINNIIEAEP